MTRKHCIFWTVMVLALALLAAQTALAAGKPSNPYQKRVRELEARVKALDRTRIPYLRASQQGVKLSIQRQPTLTETGLFTATLDQDLIDSEGPVQSMDVSFYSMDPAGYFSTEYLVTDAQPGETIESCLFVAAGDYQLVVFYYLKEGSSYADILTFTVEGDGSHPTLQQKVQQVLSECRVAGDDWQTALNLHDWLTHHAYYDLTYSYYGAEDVLLRGYGVCDSYSKAYQFLLNAAGISNERVTSNTHAWNLMKLGGQWHHTDVTWDDPSGSTAAVSGSESHDYFCINDELIYGMLDNGTHRSGATATGRCNSLAQSYPVHTGSWQNEGVYFDDTWNIQSYGQLFIDTAYLGDATFTVLGNQNYPISSSGGSYSYWPAGSRKANLARYFYAYGLTREGLTLEDDSVLKVAVSYNTSDLFFEVSVLGWQIEETGTLELPADLESIADQAFMNTAATTAQIPATCLSIGNEAFKNSDLHWISIPNAQTSIGSDALAGCSPLIMIAPDNSPAAGYAAEHHILRFRP